MFDLKKTLDKINVMPIEMANVLSIDIHSLNNILKSDDSELQFKVYEEFVQKSIDKDILIELTDFYSQFFTNKDDMNKLFTDILNYKDNKIPRRMILTVKNLIELADDIEKIRPGRDALKIFFFIVGIETLTAMHNPQRSENYSKTQMVVDFFEKYIADDDKAYILERVRRSLADELYNLEQRDSESDEEYRARIEQNKMYTKGFFNQEINMEVFARIVSEVRNIFAHEGVFWKFAFSNSDYPLINSLRVTEKYAKGKSNVLKQERIYDIELSYPDFRRICISGFINLIKSHFYK